MASVVGVPEIQNERNESGEDRRKRRLSEYYEKLGNWCDSAFEEASGLQKDIPEVREIAQALDYLGGLQWKESMPSYRAKPVSNEFMSMFWEVIGLLTDTKPSVTIKDIAAESEYSKIQQIMGELYPAWANQQRYYRSFAFTTMFAMLTSAPAKLYWNPFANGMSGDPSDGDISFEYCPISQFLRLGINKPDDLQLDECCIYSRSRTLDWIKRAYPNMGKYVTAETQVGKYTATAGSGVNVAPQFYQPLSGGMKRLLGISSEAPQESLFPKAWVREFWMQDDSINESRNTVLMGPKDQRWSYRVLPGEKLYPRGRLLVRANGITLYDEPIPYYHRKKPFALMGLYEVPWQEYAMSVVKPWMSQQDILNQIMQGLLQCVKKAVSPALMAPKSAINPEAMRAIDSSKPNLKITYNQNSPNAPIWQQPPNVPGYVQQTYATILQSMRQMSGQSAMDQAAGKKQIPGSDTLDRMTFSKTTPIRLMGRNMETFNDEIGQMWVANALQFYDARKRIQLLGVKAGLTPQDVDAKPNIMIPADVDSEAFVRSWHFKTDKGTLLNVQRQDKLQIAFALRKNHDISRKQLFKILEWNINEQENDDELAKEAEAMAMAQASGAAKAGGKHK